MLRSTLFTRSPILLSIFPFSSDNSFDKPVNEVIKPLVEDELGWDRVKKIFQINEGLFSKELQSIINVTLSSTLFGTMIGGMRSGKNAVDNFISSNEATRFRSHFDAKQTLQYRVFINFIKKGGGLGAKIGLFCCLFSTITTCTTAYRGKLTIPNYVLGGSVTGFAFKAYLGPRGALVGTAVGGILGAIYGSVTIIILKLAGISMDEILEAQHKWLSSSNEIQRKVIKESLEKEAIEIKHMYEANQRILAQQKEDNKDHKV